MHAPSHCSQILQSFVNTKPKPHTPKFHAERECLGWRLFDGADAIGLFGTRGHFFFDLWSFSPFEPNIMANKRPPGKVVDLHTLHNTTLNLPFYSGKDLVEGVTDPFERMRVKWVSDKGAEFDAEIAGEFEKGQRIAYRFRVKYDAAWARYRYFLDADAWKRSLEGFEPINLMTAGALASRPERRRWTHSIWEDPNGNLKRLVHSNALFTCTDYASEGSGEWRSKNAPLQGAWIAYAAHKEFNPAVIVHETSAPVFFATCSQLFDEHIVWQRSGLDDLDEGFFHFRMRTELVNIGYDLARDMLERAADPPRPKKWRFERIALPFRMEVVNDFEQPVDPWAPEECPILAVDIAEDAPIRWATDAARSGTRSIRLEGKVFHHWTELYPTGAVCNVEPNARYRFSARVKTKNVDRFARLELNSFEYTFHNFIDIAHSSKLCGDSDWTLLQAVLDTGDEAYVMPRFVLYGEGIAWFDDAKLERVS